jgi:hypothetical protein
MDPMSPSILAASACVVVYEGEIAIIIHHQIDPLMRKQQYKASVMFSSNNIISCKCSCRAGLHKKEKVVCVHTLPVFLQFLFYFLMVWWGSVYSDY